MHNSGDSKLEQSHAVRFSALSRINSSSRPPPPCRRQRTYSSTIRQRAATTPRVSRTLSLCSRLMNTWHSLKSGASPEQMRDETQRALDAHNAEEVEDV